MNGGTHRYLQSSGILSLQRPGTSRLHRGSCNTSPVEESAPRPWLVGGLHRKKGPGTPLVLAWTKISVTAPRFVAMAIRLSSPLCMSARRVFHGGEDPFDLATRLQTDTRATVFGG